MIRTILLTADQQRSVGGVEQIQRWRDSSTDYIWLDIESAATDETRELLESMDCNTLAISDSFRLRHPPKIEPFEHSTFILFRGISKIQGTLDFSHQQIGIWVGERFLITYHQESSISVSHMWESELENSMIASPGTLALKLLHYACGRYLDTMLEFEDRLADLEDGLLGDHSEEGMKELVGHRSRLRRLRRTFSYHKEIANEILNLPDQILPFIDQESDHLRRDVYDRSERVYSLCQMYYEICGDLVEGHISLSSHKLNQTMKILTIISALFIPLTFVAGIYGMNFAFMPELGWRYAYFVVIAFMVALTITLLILFRRIKWL
ncbi:MAG: magnesium transporter CorA family protein [Halioglobus sp.]